MSTPGRIPLVIAIAVLLLVRPVRADESTDLEKGTMSYDAGRYDEGAERLRQLLDPRSSFVLKDPSLVERARAYYAACLVALGRTDEAKLQIERIYRENPLYTPDLVVFPGKVVDLFADARDRMRSEIERAVRAKAEQEKQARLKAEKARADQAAYLAGLQQLAASESVVVRHSRWVAALPFGAGQFQNGQEGLGYALLVSELLAAGTSIASAAVWMSLVAESSNARVDKQDLQTQVSNAHLVNTYSTIAFAALAVTGILHAQLSYVPETREQRSRPIPPAPALRPGVSVGASSFALSLEGKF